MTLYLGRTAVNATLAVGGGNVDDVQVDGVSVVTNKVAEIDLTGKQDVISDLSTIRSGASAGATAVQPSDLATVATSGSYNDLDDKPTIPAAQVNSDWNSSSGVSQILNKPTLGTMAAENTTSYYTKTELDGKLNSAMHFKGTKARVADLPSSGQEVGDMWNVQSTGANYAWDGSSWDKLSENIDLSGLQPNLTSSNAGTGISITGSGSNVVISNTQTSAVWGNITGTLSNQTDLNTALNAKANDSDVVKLTGNQTIAGVKTFASTSNLYNPTITKQNSDIEGGQLHFAGANNEPNASKTIYIDRYNGTLRAVGRDSNDNSRTLLQLDFEHGTAITVTPATSDNSTKIATTAYVKNQGYVTSSGTVEKSNSVINQRDSSTAVKTWTGTKAQYDAIVTKDANTLYNITDDTDVSLTILESLYPVGSVYITTANTCPLSALISGSTWALVSSGIVTAGDIPCKGNGMTLGLMVGSTSNLSGLSTNNTGAVDNHAGSYGTSLGNVRTGTAYNSQNIGITTDATKSGIVADTSSLTLSVNIFERTA